MRAAQILKEKLDGDRPVAGILATYHLWLDLVEITSQSGMDYLLIDTEHLNHGQELVADCCAFSRRIDLPVLVRPSRTDAESIRQIMDLGPCGLLLPMIETAAQLDEAQRGAYMPPRGERRPGGRSNRWLTDIHADTIRREIEDDLIVIPQIESPRGIEHAKEIARHPLTTALGVGPYDLSARMGHCWEPGHPDLAAARASLRRTAKSAGKELWMVGPPADLIAQGCRFMCVGEASMMLENLLRQCAASVQKA